MYAAAKAYMVKLSETLSLENTDHDVHVTALCPGFTHSEFHGVKPVPAP
ncbi:MAG: SDR family NAD(P)-dependent oxidoreductase [Steroidobacteraceae bacterium]